MLCVQIPHSTTNMYRKLNKYKCSGLQCTAYYKAANTGHSISQIKRMFEAMEM